MQPVMIALTMASNTDNGTGDYSHGLTNNMNSASYSAPATCGQDSSTFAINKARATNSVRVHEY